MSTLWYSIPRPQDTANLSSWQAVPRWYDGVPFPLRHAARPDRLSTLCLQPKAGSTFFKQLLGTVLRPTVGGQCARMHCARLPYETPPQSLFAVAPIFVIVRHPVARLLSAYLDPKLHLLIREALGQQEPLTYRKAEFEALVQVLATTPPWRQNEINPHLKLQTQQCGWKAIGDRTRVLKLEERVEWLPRLMDEWWGVPTSLLNLEPVRAQTTAEARVAEYYDAARLRRVEHWAAPDTRAFRYAPYKPPWLNTSPPGRPIR